MRKITSTISKNLKEWEQNLGCKVYAFCFMTNYVHLIVDPCEKVENLALLMKHVSGKQTRYVNKTEGRRGTLWRKINLSPFEK